MVRRLLASVFLTAFPVVVIPIAVPSIGARAGAAPPTAVQHCNNGGWQTLTDASGQPFGNQGQCIAYAIHHPIVTVEPISQSATTGQTVTFSAEASGTPTPTVQWQLSVDGGTTWFDVAGLTSTSFSTGPVSAFENGWELRAVFTNDFGSATTNAATLMVETYGFSRPVDFAFDGTHIWVVNLGANGGLPPNGEGVTELNASDGSPVQKLSGGSFGFSFPRAIAFDGTHLWVANDASNSVTELNASNGSWVQTLSGGPYGFNSPDGIVFDGTHVWVANQDGNSVTELDASDGSFVQTLSGGSYGFANPVDLAFDGTHLWVSNFSGPSVTELNASDGSWIQTIAEHATGGPPGFFGPERMVFDGTHIWVVNTFSVDGVGNSVTELNASDGSFVQTVSGHFDSPIGIAFDGTHLWVTNNLGNSVTELNASDGSFVQTLSGGPYGFNSPDGIVFDGTHLWVANIDGNSVTELNASDGSLVQTLSG